MIEFVQETGSTNSDLARRLREGENVAEGHWRVADRQVAGRGRQGREWFDGTGNFMGSTVVHKRAGDPPVSTLSLVAGLALYEVAASLLADPLHLSLKWPNDLLFGRAKLAGILLEGEGASVIVGVGVNLSVTPPVQGREVTAFAEHGPAPARDLFAERLAAQFALDLERWRTYGLEPIIARWQAVGHKIGTSLTVHDPDGSLVSGEFGGLAADGSLNLRLADGSTRAIHAGDVILT